MIEIEDYKQHIIDEYEKLMAEEKSDDKKKYIHLVAYGNEGLEGYFVTKDIKKLGVIHRMELRARFNSHRQIGVYGFMSDFVVDEDMINDDLLNMDDVVKLY